MALDKKVDSSVEKDKQNLLAKKTLEHLQVISIADVILKEKFAGDNNLWVTALFEAIALKNPTYLAEENNLVNDDSGSLLYNKFGESFWEKDNYNNVMNTGHQLIDVFNKFMTGLNQNANKFNFGESLTELKQIEKNTHNYLQKQYNFGSECTEKPLSVGESPVEAKEKEILISGEGSKSNTNAIVCSECNMKIIIFNNDIQFSIDLHSQEPVHKKAMIKSQKSIGEKCRSFEKRNSETDMSSEEKRSVRATLNSRIKNHSSFINILSKREFYCNLCKCDISSIQNVESHVDGSKHKRTLEIHAKKPVDDVLQDHLLIPIAKLY